MYVYRENIINSAFILRACKKWVMKSWLHKYMYKNHQKWWWSCACL